MIQDGVRRTKMVQLADLFSLPEMGLLCNVTEYFLQNHIDFHPEILFRDVKVRKCWWYSLIILFCTLSSRIHESKKFSFRIQFKAAIR